MASSGVDSKSQQQQQQRRSTRTQHTSKKMDNNVNIQMNVEITSDGPHDGLMLINAIAPTHDKAGNLLSYPQILQNLQVRWELWDNQINLLGTLRHSN